MLGWRQTQRVDLVTVLLEVEVEYHGGLIMVEPVMVPGIAMMGFVVVVVVVVLPNSVRQMDLALGQGCLFERLRQRVMVSPLCLMFVGWRLLLAAAFLGN